MELTILNKTELPINWTIVTTVALNDYSVALLVCDKLTDVITLVVQTLPKPDNPQQAPITHYICLANLGLGKSYEISSQTLLVSWDEKPCLILSKEKAYWFSDMESPPLEIKIEGVNILPFEFSIKTNFFYSNTHSDTDLFVVSMTHNKIDLQASPRHFGLLQTDSQHSKLKWISSATVPASLFNALEPSMSGAVKIDGGLIKNKFIYLFCPGATTGSVAKWGMDFYGIVRAPLLNLDSNVSVGDFELLYESDDLWQLLPKKSGANGLFSTDGSSVVLTPVFSSDDWKGRPKLYDFASKSLQNISLPRGVSKGYVFQKTASHLWYFKSVSEQIEGSYLSNSKTTLYCLRSE